MESIAQRFLRHVNKTSDCWYWTGYIGRHGYGSFRLDGKRINAHRASYILFKGVPPEGHEIDHLCRIRKCVRPDHLEAVTRQENRQRVVSPPERYHYDKDHPFNAIHLKQGPICGTCRARSNLKRNLIGAV